MARLVARRPGLASVGAVDESPGRLGRDLGEVAELGITTGLTVHDDPMAVLTAARPDVTLLSFGSRVEEVGRQVLQAMEAGSNVICLAGGMAYPWAVQPDLAESLDELAHAHGVTVLGTGLNPGFVLDTLVVALTGCCWDVDRVKASRVSDLTRLGKDVLAQRGIGLSPSRFGAAAERGSVSGHVGLEESVYLIADALGWKLDRVQQRFDPILAEVRREAEGIRVDPGQVAGVLNAAVGYVDGLPRILLEHPEHFLPEAEGIPTGDFIDIDGVPGIHLALQPQIDALRGASAMAVNMIPAVLRTGPGLKTMAEMPVPRAVLGDIRELLEVQGPTVEEELARGWHSPGLGGNDPQGRDQSGIESP